MGAVLRLLFWSWPGAVVVASELSPTSSGRKDGLKHVYTSYTKSPRVVKVTFFAHQIFNPIIPSSGAPKVKSQHNGLPDDPMPYNGNYKLCLGIN